MIVKIRRFEVGIDGDISLAGHKYLKELALMEVKHHVYFIAEDQQYEVTSEETVPGLWPPELP